MPGFRLDRYELLAPIAEGGMGQVWLARLLGKRGFEKLVAIKVPRLSADSHFQQMLLDEARIAAAIEHVNVAQILELGEQGDILYIVMEWVDGDALSTLLRKLDKEGLPFPPAIALRIVSDTCAGAHAAHELRDAKGTLLEVVHRDISPQNMLVTRAGTVKLIDFGIAKARSRAAADTTEGTIKGKIKYMAPEQALASRVDRRADIFSLGAVLYRLLAGYPPYGGDNDVATLHQLVTGVPPRRLPEHIPAPVAELAYKALAAAPEARFQSAAEMQRAIARAMADCKLVAEAEDVAAFVSTHFYKQQSQRARAIEIALKAAGDRAAVLELLRTPPSSPSIPSEDTGSGSMATLGRAGVQITSSGANSSSSHPRVQNPSITELDFSSRPHMLRRLVSAAVVLGAIGLVLIVFVIATSARDGASTPSAELRTSANEAYERGPSPSELNAAREASSSNLAEVAPVHSASASSTPGQEVEPPEASASASAVKPPASPPPLTKPGVPAQRRGKPVGKKPTTPDFGY